LAKTEEYSIPAAGGGLAAVVHRPAGGRPEFGVIFCHGFRGSKEGGGRAAGLAAEVAALGLAAVRFDFTPQSPLSRQTAELAAVVDHCRRAVSPRVILFGRSMGGSAALALAAADRRIAGLCLWSAPCDLAATFRLALGENYDRLARGETVDIADEYGRFQLTPAFIRDFAAFDLPAAVVAISGTPLLIVHGAADAIVPPAQAREMYARANPPKEIVVIPGADHRFLAGYDKASGAVLAWLARTFAAGG